jgi:NADH dehydrogenase/NADH:ubiquinone oxidoreductase subunit G
MNEIGVFLCYHPAISPYGACRLCSVEVVQRGRSRVVISCMYPVAPGLEVRTNTERIRRLRRGIMELLLARCSENEPMRALAAEFGVTQPRFALEADECILCGLCVRVCQETSEAKVLSFVGRGAEKEVAPPFYEPSEACINCGGCAYVCPTKAIRFEGDKLVFPWMRKTEPAETKQ